MTGKLALLLQHKRKQTQTTTDKHSKHPLKRQKKTPAGKHHQHHQQKQQQQQQQQQQQAHANGAAAAASGDADEEEEFGELEAPAAAGQAYSALVGMLSKQRGSNFSAALKLHRAQQEGLSDASESESESEGHTDDSYEEQQQRRRQQKRVPPTKGTATGGKQAAAAAATAAIDAAAAADDEGEDDDDDDNNKSDRNPPGTDTNSHAQQEQQQEQQEGQDPEGDPDDAGIAAAAAGTAAAAAAVAGSSGSSQWEGFMSRELSDAEVFELRSGSTNWREAAAGQDPTEGLWKRARWQFSGREGFPAAPDRLAEYGVKERLINRWQEVHQEDAERLSSHHAATTSSSHGHARTRTGDFTSPQQKQLFSLFDSYADVCYSAKPYPGGPSWSPLQPDEVLDAVLLHVLNHCAKTADVIKKNNDKIKALDPGSVSDVPRDQGFTRPKVLLLLPMRNSAFKAVKRLVTLAQKETRADSVQGKEKFVEQFVGDDDDEEQEQLLLQQQQQQQQQEGGQKQKGAPKPQEHQALFAGNLDDHFRLGIRITRGQIKLFADLMQSDIIVASPLGLATKLAEDAAAAAAAAAAGSDGRGGKKGGGSSGSSAGGDGADFLSSVEICVVERADVMLMQNWQQVVTVLEALNQLPKHQHGVNIMRVKAHLLASQGALYRQTILTSSFACPQLNATFSKLCSSHAGKFRLVAQPAGVLTQVVPQVRQLFERFSAPSAAAAADARFEFFKATIWPRLSEGATGGLLLVVPSSFDFVRLRNFLKAEEADYAVLSEYSTFQQVTRARALFFQRRKRLLLYTERAHFYHRYRIRGIQDILFYSLPEHAHFYAELVNLVQTGGGAAAAGHHATVTTLFCQYDALALARVVGQSRAAKMLAAGCSPTFVFC